MKYEILPLGALVANCTIIWNESGNAWIVDPGDEAKDIIAFLKERSLTPVAILLTHGHFDHIGALPTLTKEFPSVPVHVGPADLQVIDHPLNEWPPEYKRIEKPSSTIGDLTDNAVISAGGIEATIISTPGHTPGSVCIYFKNENLLLSGDTLFAGSCGRTDFPGGNMDDMRVSLKRLMELPPETVVIPGHCESTTIGKEKTSNPYIQ